MTYIGGVGGFFGPILGAILIVLLQSGVSLLSQRLAGLYRRAVHRHGDVCAGRPDRTNRQAQADLRIGRLRELVVPYARALVPALLVAVRLRAAGRNGLLHDHRRGPGQEILVRRPGHRPPRCRG